MRRDRKTRAQTRGAPADAARPPAKEGTGGFTSRRHLFAIGALWLAVLLVYSNSFVAGLIWDNDALILRDPRVTAVTSENVHRIWREEYWINQSGNGLYRPVTTLSYLFNYSVLGNGDRPAGYHWVNFSLHALNTSLLYLLGLAIFRRKIAPSLALAMVWAVHPVLTESVTNVVGRADLLAGFGMLAGILCYRRGAGSDGWRIWAWFLAAALAAATGMFSKESGIVIPLVAVIFDICLPPESEGARRRGFWGYAALALPCVLYFIVRPPLSPIHIPFTDNPLVGASFWTARLTALKVIGKYIGLLLFPMTLSLDYSYNTIPVFTWSLKGWEDWQVMATLAACAGIGALAIYGWQRDRRWLFFIGLSAIGLAPVANIARLIGTIMAERFLYVPSMGFAGCVVLAIMALSRRFAGRAAYVFAAALSVLCLCFGARSYARNLDWLDNRSMSKSQSQAVPNSYKARAFYYGSLEDSIRNVDVALAILDGLPDYRNTPIVYINAGKWFRDRGDKFAASDPAQSAVWYRRSLDVLLRGERIMKAANENRFEVYEQLGLTYTKLKDYSNALQALDAARRQTFSENLIRATSSAYIQMGDLHQAELTLWEGRLVDPKNSHFAAWLLELYRRSDPGSCALDSQAAGSPNLGCPLVHEQACAASVNLSHKFRDGGRQQDAIRTLDVGSREFGCQAGRE